FEPLLKEIIPILGKIAPKIREREKFIIQQVTESVRDIEKKHAPKTPPRNKRSIASLVQSAIAPDELLEERRPAHGHFSFKIKCDGQPIKKRCIEIEKKVNEQLKSEQAAMAIFKIIDVQEASPGEVSMEALAGSKAVDWLQQTVSR